jgi:hypothetical protein
VATAARWLATGCRTAVEGGHLDVLQWARANSCDWDRDHCLDVAPAGSETQRWIQASRPDKGNGGNAHGGRRATRLHASCNKSTMVVPVTLRDTQTRGSTSHIV